MLGFTKQEQGIILFLIISLIVGASVQFYQRFFSENNAFGLNQDFVNAFSKKAEEINSTQDDEEAELTHGKNDVIRSDNPIASKEAQPVYVTRPERLEVETQDEFVIDVNSANAEELQLIPRIGPVLAQRIIQYRRENGKFNQLEDLKQIKGIGTATFDKIAPYMKVDGPDAN